MKAEGFMEQVWNAHLTKVGDISCLAEEDIAGAGRLTGGNSDTVSLTLEEMAGIFILHGIFAAIALTLALIRFFLVRKKNPEEMLERLGLAKDDSDNDGEDDPTDTRNQSSISPSVEIAGPNEFWDRQRRRRT